jgi:putative membrane protein
VNEVPVAAPIEVGPVADGEQAREWRRTDPLGLVARIVVNLQRAILPLVAVAFGGREWGGAAGVAAMILLVLLIHGIAACLGWRQHRYRIGNDDIRVERGLISRTARTVPFERIQDVSLEEAPIARLLGLVEVRFETGAGGKDEVTLAYVSRAEGRALRETVRARQADAAGEVLASAPAVAAGPRARTLFAMDLPRLLTFGLFEFSLVVFAVLFGAAQQFDVLLPFDIWDIEEWQAQADLPLHLLLDLGLAAQAVAAILGLIVVGLVGLATGMVRTVLRDYGFLLEETERGLRRRRGLLTRTDVVMPLHRVQALKVTTGIVRRRFGFNGGWHALDLVSLARDAKFATHTVVPFGRLDEIARVAEVTGFALPEPDSQWRRPSARHRFDHALLSALPFGLAAAGLAVAGLILLALALGALAALMAARQLFLWRHDRHALDERHLYVRRGWLAPRLDVGSRMKLQSVEIAQGPIARRRGYADLVFGVAGGTLKIEGIALAEALAVREAVLESIAAVDFSQLPDGGRTPPPVLPFRAEESGATARLVSR